MPTQTLTVEIRSRFVLRILEQLASVNLISFVKPLSDKEIAELPEKEGTFNEREVAEVLSEIYRQHPLKTLTKEAFVARILDAEAQIDRGDYITVEELERQAASWD